MSAPATPPWAYKGDPIQGSDTALYLPYAHIAPRRNGMCQSTSQTFTNREVDTAGRGTTATSSIPAAEVGCDGLMATVAADDYRNNGIQDREPPLYQQRPDLHSTHNLGRSPDGTAILPGCGRSTRLGEQRSAVGQSSLQQWSGRPDNQTSGQVLLCSRVRIYLPLRSAPKPRWHSG